MESRTLEIVIQGGAVGLCALLMVLNWKSSAALGRKIDHLVDTVSKGNILMIRELNQMSYRITDKIADAAKMRREGDRVS